ncbi:hypothetical protein [Lysobacter sp. Hz 25]|uniref:hypothetical protein n=1 Tax=Lysobacter sp. Hz 25 TaxID=3383698 RepID=UPI0038D360EC
MGYTKGMVAWEERLPEAPDAAFIDHTREVDDFWLPDAHENDQVAAIVQWFLARFCDPAQETPYMSSEGGYIWVHGGPYDAREQIEQRFEGLVSEEVIKRAVDLVEEDGNYEWAPTRLTYYDESYDVEVDERNEATKRLESRLIQLLRVLGLTGDEKIKEVARNLVYSGVIAALETFLWETMTYWVDHNEATVQNLITKHPAFRERSFKLGEIYELPTKLVGEVKAYMQNLVWHRAEQVGALFKYGLSINLGYRGFEDAIKKRHDIVHRSGNDVNGKPIVVTDSEIMDLATKVKVFAEEVDGKIAAALRAPQSVDMASVADPGQHVAPASTKPS